METGRGAHPGAFSAEILARLLPQSAESHPPCCCVSGEKSENGFAQKAKMFARFHVGAVSRVRTSKTVLRLGACRRPFVCFSTAPKVFAFLAADLDSVFVDVSSCSAAIRPGFHVQARSQDRARFNRYPERALHGPLWLPSRSRFRHSGNSGSPHWRAIGYFYRGVWRAWLR